MLLQFVAEGIHAGLALVAVKVPGGDAGECEAEHHAEVVDVQVERLVFRCVRGKIF